MARYLYKARDGEGRSITGTVQAISPDEAGRMLRSEGKFVVDLEPVADEHIGTPSVRTAHRIRREEVITFVHQLAVMVDTGVPLRDALDCAVAQTQNETFCKVLREVNAQVQAGNEFSSALAQFPKVFPPVMISLVRASESSGTMGVMLERISSYLAKENQTRKKIRNALMYPCFMLLAAVTVTVFLLTLVLPRFAVIYEGRGATLPGPTQILMTTSNIMVEHWQVLLGSTVAAFVGMVLFVRSRAGRRSIDYLKLNTPIIRQIYLKLYVTRACRTMGTMVAAGVAMLDMVRIVREVTNNVFFEELWDEVDDRLRKGAQLSDPLFASALVPRSVSQMIYSGEKSGRLGSVMNRIAEYTEEEFDDAVKTSTQFIEPLMIAFMGLLIGFIAIALLLPIFNVGRVMAGA